MNRTEFLEFFMLLSRTSDEALKRDLRSIGRIREENLDLAVSLLRKLATNQGRMEIAEKLSSDDLHPNGCVGAVDPALFLLQPATISELTYLIANNIKGTDLYTLWNDCSRRDTKRFILNIWALQSGVYKQSEIDENFRINHITFKRGLYGFIDIPDKEEEKWFDRVQRSVVFPFIYDESIVDPRGYMKDLSKADPNGEDFKSYVKANRAYQRFSHYLSQSELRTKGPAKANGKNEIVVSMVLPKYSYGAYGRCLGWVQPENEAPETFAIDTNQLLEILVDRPASKHYDMMNRFDLMTAIHYLRHSKKQFLPGFAVIRTLPQENAKDFYTNNNHKRYGELVRLGKYENFAEQEGFVKLAFVLGLFSGSENESKVAYEYLKNYVIGKVNGSDIHKLYGAFNLQNGYNKDFAQFFMIHHSQNPHCFENANGVDRTDQIYANFDKILAFRPEKKIRTTTNRERLTPEDALSALTDACAMLGLPAEYSRYANVIGKYTSDKDEILWCIERLKQAEKIEEKDVLIPYVIDSADASCKFRVLKKGDPEIAIAGRRSNCCFRYRGESEKSLSHAIISYSSTVVEFESERGYYTQGWVWYDADNELLVIDNLEGLPERSKEDRSVCDELMLAVLRYADQTMTELNKRGHACSSINLGTRYLNDIIAKTLEKFEKLGLIRKAEHSNTDYPTTRKLYTDALEQYVLTDRELIKKHSAYTGAQLEEVHEG